MLAPKLRNRVFTLWTMFWSSGMANPLNAIEQITYLLFLKMLEDLDKERVARGLPTIYYQEKVKDNNTGEEKIIDYGTCRWTYIKKTGDHQHIKDVVFPWLRNIDVILRRTSADDTEEAEGKDSEEKVDAAPDRMIRYMEDASFQLDRDKEAMLKRSLNIIDELFNTATSANADLLGDIFEYLLDEVRSSGKNGQFRTPRHIIRFMIELVDVQKGERVLDPAAGSAGFLINTVLHLKKKVTDPATLRLEWDGSPHRLLMDNDVEPPYIEEFLKGDYFEGYDNDRTMVRIAWMNMVLHGIQNPIIIRGDSLSKNFQGDTGGYDVVLANPPFTGTVDTEDLDEDRFHRPVGKSGKTAAITNKSELLFVWLFLDMLKLGGRAAVVVPEGVLFGSTNAHKELRRELLLENEVEAVISLPAGVFQPYSGVKTSILYFKKRGELPTDQTPRTTHVWFYEIEADGRTMDAKRDEQPEPNDIWDALHKYHDLNKVVENTAYYQPELFAARWRDVDGEFLKIFPNLAHEKDNTLGIDERFADLPGDPEAATRQIVEAQQPNLLTLYLQFTMENKDEALAAAEKQKTPAKKKKAASDVVIKPLDKLFRETAKEILEQGKIKGVTPFALNELNTCLKETRRVVRDRVEALLKPEAPDIEILPSEFLDQVTADLPAETDKWQAQVTTIVREFAKLDGYDVLLRNAAPPTKQDEPLPESKSWLAPVRKWVRNDDWENEEKKIKGSHDEQGQVRPEYVQAHINSEDGSVTNPDLLEPDCIEANDYNLSAGRYKPFKLQAVDYDPPAHIIRNLQKMGADIQAGLSRLLVMVEGKNG